VITPVAAQFHALVVLLAGHFLNFIIKYCLCCRKIITLRYLSEILCLICRCRSAGTTAGGGDHVTCTCGEHCGCNPCSCPKTAAAGSGCRCGSECACVSCRS